MTFDNLDEIKPIAIYLPQFHPIPENDDWWGKGFTEWTNVTRSKPKFKGHYQPHLPADMGFYDLRVIKTHIDQAALAREYGVYGFCYYHYWFNGQLLLEEPLHLVLENPGIGMPFCLCWANENWTRVWDGGENNILRAQQYNLEDDLAHIQYLIRFFKDERYIKIDGKPVFLMYRSELHPEIGAAANLWREEVKKAGFPDIFLIRVENFVKGVDPGEFNFDAGLEFAPDRFDFGRNEVYQHPVIDYTMSYAHRKDIYRSAYFDQKVYAYQKLVEHAINKKDVNYKYFRSVCPSWDNSSRREKGATIFVDATPELFESWLKVVIEKTRQAFAPSERFFFINAWNEWAEGCHLEPDQKWGRAYLEAIKRTCKA